MPIQRTLRSVPVASLAALLVLLAGCKSKPAVDDASLSRSVQSQIAGDSSLAGLGVQSEVSGGIATLSGSVLNNAQRTIAARDAAGVAGVQKVIDNLSVAPAPQLSVTTELPAPVPVAPVPAPTRLLPVPAPKADRMPKPLPVPHMPAPVERPEQAYTPPPPPPVAQPAPTPPRPTFRNVTLAAGSILPVRITQTLDSATTQQGDAFSGVLTADVLVGGAVAIPSGSSIGGRVDAVQEAAHFKGASLLSVSLTSVSRRGERIPVASDPYTVEGKGRGKNTAEKTGGGAAVGAILGGIFGGGKGAAIGAGAGAGVGAGSNAITRGQQVQIPSETVIRFTTSLPVTVRVRTDDPQQTYNDSGLQPR